MRPLPALPTLPSFGPELPALLAATSAAGFPDALLAFLSPESLPTLDAEAAKALGWPDVLRAAGGEKPPSGEAAGLDAPAERTDAACQAAAPPQLALLAGLPIAAAVIAPQPASAPAPAGSGARLRSALESLQSLGAGGPRELPERALASAPAPGKSEAFTFEMLEAHFAPTAAGAPPASPAVQAPPLKIEAPLGSAQFGEQAADTLRWMVRQGESRAEITLRPAELGPIQIELKIVADRAEVVFVAAHPDTRDALQGQLPQLQELLAESGIELGQASVRDQAGKHPAFLAIEAPGEPEAPDTPAETAVHPRRGSGLVDTFA